MISDIVISALYSYPIKGCAALSHDQILLDERGPVWDRRWMLVDGDGLFVSQRERPALARVQPALDAESLRISTAGMPPLVIPLQAARGVPRAVTIWNDICEAWDEGRAAGEWFSQFLGDAVRLVRMTDSWFRTVDPRYAPQPAQTGFSDGFPLLLVSEESLDDLNGRLQGQGSQPVPMNRFRPNVVVRGAGPFAEDGWRTLRAGAVTLDVVKPCARCLVTTVDQQTGTIPDRAEPLATLSSYRKQGSKVLFTQNVVHRAPGSLAVGTPLEILA